MLELTNGVRLALWGGRLLNNSESANDVPEQSERDAGNEVSLQQPERSEVSNVAHQTVKFIYLFHVF